MKNLKFLSLALLGTLLVTSCGEPNMSKQEQLQKLDAIGHRLNSNGEEVLADVDGLKLVINTSYDNTEDKPISGTYCNTVEINLAAQWMHLTSTTETVRPDKTEKNSSENYVYIKNNEYFNIDVTNKRYKHYAFTEDMIEAKEFMNKAISNIAYVFSNIDVELEIIITASNDAIEGENESEGGIDIKLGFQIEKNEYEMPFTDDYSFDFNSTFAYKVYSLTGQEKRAVKHDVSASVKDCLPRSLSYVKETTYPDGKLDKATNDTTVEYKVPAPTYIDDLTGYTQQF